MSLAKDPGLEDNVVEVRTQIERDIQNFQEIWERLSSVAVMPNDFIVSCKFPALCSGAFDFGVLKVTYEMNRNPGRSLDPVGPKQLWKMDLSRYNMAVRSMDLTEQQYRSEKHDQGA